MTAGGARPCPCVPVLGFACNGGTVQINRVIIDRVCRRICGRIGRRLCGRSRGNGRRSGGSLGGLLGHRLCGQSRSVHILARVADAGIHARGIALYHGRVGDCDGSVAVHVARNNLRLGGSHDLGGDALDKGRVNNIDRAVKVGVADEELGGGSRGRLGGLVGRLLGGRCGRLAGLLGGLLGSGLSRLLAALAVVVNYVDRADGILAFRVGRREVIGFARERRGGVGIGGLDLACGLDHVVRDLLTGLGVNMAGDDLSVEGGHAALDPGLADAEVADVAGILLGVGGAVAVVEERVRLGSGEARAVPVVALGGHDLCGVPLAVELSGLARSVGVVRVAADCRPAAGVLVVDSDGVGAERSVDVLDVDGAREGSRGVGGDLGGVELIARDGDGRGAVGGADLAAELFGLCELLAGGVNVADVHIAGACAGNIINEGDGVGAAGGDGAAGLALSLDKLIVEEEIGVGSCAVGHARLVLGGLGLEDIAVLVNVVDGQGAGALLNDEVVEARLVNEHDAALSGNGVGVARDLAEALEACGGAVGDDDPAGAVEGDIMTL